MKTFGERIRRRWGQMTMLRLLIAIILGITLADCAVFPLWSLAVGFVIMVGAAWMWRRRAMGDIYIMAAAALAAMITMGISTSHSPNTTARQTTIPSWAIELRQKAEQRIEKMGLQPEVEAIAKGVTIGSRGAITPALWQRYSRSGAAHLLAVSGLHVGFIFFMINIVLGGLALLRRGPLLRSGLTIICIWIYALVAGATPSIVRAALMFTLLQLAMSASRGGEPLNRLAGVAALMLVWDGRWLYNAGFMLSFISVAAIVEWGIPLSRVRLRHRGIWGKAQSEVERIELMRTAKGWLQFAGRRLARSLWTALAISIVASIATMPLVSHMFGVVTLWSIVVGPVMVLLCSIVVGATMVQIAMGCGWTENFIGGIVELAGGAMNSIADWCSSSGALIAEYHISQLCTIVCYAGFISLTVVKWGVQD